MHIPRRSFLRFLALAILLATAAVLDGGAASAQSVAEFYKGKQIRFIIRSGVGGGYDSYSRLLARHIGRHIPGNPDIIPINMPGGGGITAANYVAEVAPKDGTILTMVSQGLPMDQALGLSKSLKADMRSFNWIGNMSDSNQLTYTWHTSPVKTIQDAMKTSATLGATGAGSTSVTIPAVYNSILGTKFNIIFGYTDGAAVKLAMERGEVDGVGINPWAALSTSQPHYIRDKLVNILVQVGLKKEKDLPHVPLLRDLATNPDDKAVLDYVSKGVAVGRPVGTTPGVPADRVAALRAAFDATLKDPRFIAEAEKQGAEISAMTGAELQQIIDDLLAAPQSVKDRVAQAMQPRSARSAPGSSSGAGSGDGGE